MHSHENHRNCVFDHVVDYVFVLSVSIGEKNYLTFFHFLGERVCDATLVSARWLITHTECAHKTVTENQKER